MPVVNVTVFGNRIYKCCQRLFVGQYSSFSRGCILKLKIYHIWEDKEQVYIIRAFKCLRFKKEKNTFISQIANYLKSNGLKEKQKFKFILSVKI